MCRYLCIEPGMQVAVIGPSAAGKSTLVRAILGIYLPSAGGVRLDGAEIHHWDRSQLSPRRLGCGTNPNIRLWRGLRWGSFVTPIYRLRVFHSDTGEGT
ncbi:MAG: ATP-binding cassette domain-containing protein [Candidatus Methylumidiphilus sp.]